MSFASARARTAGTRRSSGLSRSAQMQAAMVAAAQPLGQKIAESHGTDDPLSNVATSMSDVEIWELFDEIPEVRSAARITGQAMSQCRLVVARVDHNGEPRPLDVGTDEEPGPDHDHPGPRLLAKFAGGMGGQQALLDALGVFLTTTGEAVLVGKVDPFQANPADDFDRLQVYSADQVRSRGDHYVVRTGESIKSDRVVDTEDGYDAVRIWRPHPRYNWLPDSAVRASKTVLREIKMYDDHTQATGKSRLAGRGLLFVNEDVTLPVSQADDEPHEDGQEIDPFMVLLMEVMSLALRDPTSAAAMVPILIRCADPEKAAKLIDFTTPFDTALDGKRDQALSRFAVAVDMPPEILTGFGALQHWTGSLVSEDWKNSYLATLMGFTTSSITQGWYLPALMEAGYGDLPNDTIIWYDDSSVRTREDTGSEAQAAYDRGEIDGDAYRRALGFDGEDKPDPKELIEMGLRQAIVRGSALAPMALAYFGMEPNAAQIAAAKEIASVQGSAASADNGRSTGSEPSGVSPAPGTASEPVVGMLPDGATPAMRQALALLEAEGRIGPIRGN